MRWPDAKATTKSNAYNVQAIPKERAEAAAKAVYHWLQSSNTTIRSVLKFLAKGGLWYTAFANEKLSRAFPSSEPVSEGKFKALCLHRLCPVAPESEASEDGATDWASMKKRKR